MAKEMTPQAASADEEKQRIRDEKKKLKKGITGLLTIVLFQPP